MEARTPPREGGALTLAQAIEEIKAKLSIDAALKGKAAVTAARAELLQRGSLREQVASLCRELAIDYEDGADVAVLREECVRLRAENETLRRESATLAAASTPPQTPQHATPSRGPAGVGVAISFDSPRVQELRAKVRAASAEGKYSEVVAACTEAVKLVPSDVNLRLQRARAQAELGDYSGALDDATLCTNAEPNMWRAWKLQAQAHMQLMHFEQAAQAYQLAQQTVPPAYQQAQATELAKGYNNAILMNHQLSSRGPRTPAKDEETAERTKKRRSSAFAHSGPGPKVMEQIRKMQTDVGDGSALFDLKIDNPLLESMADTPRERAQEVEVAHVDVYDTLTKRCKIHRNYRICEPCTPSSVPGRNGAISCIGSGRGEMTTGQEVVGVELCVMPAGDVYVRLESQVLPDSMRMETVEGEMRFELPPFHETARDFTRAYVAGSGDMLFMSPDIGMTEPLALPCTISATGDVNQDVTDRAVAEFGQFLATSFRAISDQADRTLPQPSDALVQRIIANLTVTPGMQCLLDNGLSPAIFQNKYVVVLGCGQIRVVTYGFCGEPVTGDRPDRKATPYYLKIVSGDLTQLARDNSLPAVYAVRSTLHVDIDAVMSEDVSSLSECLQSGDWSSALKGGPGLGWLRAAYPPLEEPDVPLPCLEVFPLQCNDKTGLPVPLQDEQPRASLKDVKLRVFGVSGSISSGSITLTDSRIIWIPEKATRRRRRSSVTAGLTSADIGRLSIPLNRLGAIAFDSRGIRFTVAQIDLSKAGGRFSWSVGGIAMQIEMGRQSVRIEAFYWLLRQVVDLTLRLQPSYEPKFVAEDLLAEQCATAIRSDSNASAIARQWKHAAEEAEASASPESSLTPSQMDVGDLLPEARQAVMELRDDICEKHRLTFRKIFKATPGLYRSSRAPPLLKMAFVKILNQGPQIGVAQAARPAPLGVLLLTSSCLEVYEELVDAESPFDLVATYDLTEQLVAAEMKRHPSTMHQTELLHLQLSAPSDSPVWFDARSAEVLRDWKAAISQAIVDAGAGPMSTEQTAEEEDGEEEDDNRAVDEYVDLYVRCWLERAIIGPHLSLLMRSAEISCELPPATIDGAIARAKEKSQSNGIFAIPETDRDPDVRPWQDACTQLDRMGMAPILPVELSACLRASQSAIYATHHARKPQQDLGPESYLAILTYALSKTQTENLAILLEMMRHFATTQAERTELALSSAALQNLMKNDTNEMCVTNRQIL